MDFKSSKSSPRCDLKKLLKDKFDVEVAGFDKIEFSSTPSGKDYAFVRNFIDKIDDILLSALTRPTNFGVDKEKSLRLSVSQIHPLIVDAFNKGLISSCDGENIASALYDKVQYIIASRGYW